MTTNKSILLDLLRQQNSELAVRYDFIRQELGANIQKYAVSMGELPNYGPDHCKNVEETIDLLIPDNVKGNLNSNELFLLLCAIQFHRIGLLYERETDEPTDSILRNYPERTYNYLHEHYEEWHLSKYEAGLIKQICLGLVYKGFEELSETQVLQRSVIRVKFLAALLRLGDALDIDYTTVSRYLLNLRKLSAGSIEQWIARTDIAGIDIQPDRWGITIFIAPATVEGREFLKKFIEDKVQSELDFVRSVLSVYGLFYDVIHVELVSELLRLDTKIQTALQEFYRIQGQTEIRENPYKFLDYFEPGDANFFFGRQSDIQRFMGYIQKNKLVVLYGESGVGKTSLINAGLIPALVNEGCIPVYLRCFDEPGKIIKIEIQKLRSFFSPYEVDSSLDLEIFLEMSTKIGYKLVIFIDQFEEFFIKFPQNVQDEFVAQLINCLNKAPSLNVTFVLSLRREYFIELGRYKSRLLELFNNAFELRKLTADEIEDAITEPAGQIGVHYEPRLIKELVQDIYQGGNYNTPHIQIICDKLVRALDKDKQRLISSSLYESLGRARKILAEYLDAEITKFPLLVQSQIKTILKEMVTSRGTKSISTASEIALRSHLSLDETEILMWDLVNRSRLLRKLEIQGEVVYELTHEFLVARVSDWLEEKDIEVKAVYEMLDRQIIERDRYSFFLDKERLNQVNQYRDRLSLDDDKKELILDSYLHSDPENRDKSYWIDNLEIGVVVKVFVKSLSTSSAVTYQESVRLLTQLGASVIEYLLPYLSNTNWQIRLGVIDTLVGIGSSTITPLLSLLDDDNRRTRRGAVAVLAKLGEVCKKPLQKKLAVSSGRTASIIDECLSLLDFYATRKL